MTYRRRIDHFLFYRATLVIQSRAEHCKVKEIGESRIIYVHMHYLRYVAKSQISTDQGFGQCTRQCTGQRAGKQANRQSPLCIVKGRDCSFISNALPNRMVTQQLLISLYIKLLFTRAGPSQCFRQSLADLVTN